MFQLPAAPQPWSITQAAVIEDPAGVPPEIAAERERQPPLWLVKPVVT